MVTPEGLDGYDSPADFQEDIGTEVEWPRNTLGPGAVIVDTYRISEVRMVRGQWDEAEAIARHVPHRERKLGGVIDRSGRGVNF
jgi:hypothetical protein